MNADYRTGRARGAFASVRRTRSDAGRQGLAGARLVSSHSGDLVASVDPLSVRRFVRRGGGIDVQRIRRNTLNAEETRKSTFTYAAAEANCCLQDAR